MCAHVCARVKCVNACARTHTCKQRAWACAHTRTSTHTHTRWARTHAHIPLGSHRAIVSNCRTSDRRHTGRLRGSRRGQRDHKSDPRLASTAREMGERGNATSRHALPQTSSMLSCGAARWDLGCEAKRSGCTRDPYTAGGRAGRELERRGREGEGSAGSHEARPHNGGIGAGRLLLPLPSSDAR